MVPMEKMVTCMFKHNGSLMIRKQTLHLENRKRYRLDKLTLLYNNPRYLKQL